MASVLITDREENIPASLGMAVTRPLASTKVAGIRLFNPIVA